MAEIKSFRIRSDRAAWLKKEAAASEVSQNRIVEELISEAMAIGWHFGRLLTVSDQAP